jgi:hypothetical protein
VLLQMAAAPVDGPRGAGERAAVLGVLCLLCESASLAQQAQHANQDMLLAAPCCWQQLLLDCMRASSSGGGSEVELAAACSAWRLLAVLLARGTAASSSGWHRLQTLVSLLKAQPDGHYYCSSSPSGANSPSNSIIPRSPSRSATSGWHFLQELLADVLHELLTAQAADAATSAVSPTAAAAAGVGRGPGRASSEWEAWTVVSQVCNLQFHFAFCCSTLLCAAPALRDATSSPIL